ncbi:MAG: fused MFS/spermidine synthase [Pseudomonadales bacterium]|jgi:spermidine synthase|nr:fused MFS/spermidine synthase [Pseudomonadales bacterium]MDP6472890.1 fused MFS/spermidine synthase [Pseudomonadales bacterium]MDP6826353.1 fused MFS/spermidine synthase [Pseudomonadales bacterium]MDP6973284.1 fused MFS/spermidine synthase [Pseudomonadales bacterium]
MRSLLLAVTLLLLPLAVWGEIIHRERSLYQTILIDRRGAELCLQFSIRRDQRNQSCINKRNPKKMVFSYTRMMMASLLLNPQPRRILVVGLGGGTLPTALAALLPEAIVHVVEIDAAVVRVAEEYFGFAQSEVLKVFTQDARVFTKRAGSRGETYDLIMLDAYNGDYIPEHLMTREYLEETRALLAHGGVLAANTFAVSRLYDHESATYASVFGEFFNLRLNKSANRVILAATRALPQLATMRTRAARLARPLSAYGVDIQDYPSSMSRDADWDRNARVLTDQYAPANLLNRD